MALMLVRTVSLYVIVFVEASYFITWKLNP